MPGGKPSFGPASTALRAWLAPMACRAGCSSPGDAPICSSSTLSASLMDGWRTDWAAPAPRATGRPRRGSVRGALG
eukprot:6386373-Alexandrium_andersonii.AAC.1